MSILVEKTPEKITKIIFNRPEKRNSLNLEIIDQLIETLRSLLDDVETRVVIISGKGSVFSAGGDINEMPSRFGKALVTKNRLDQGLSQIVRLIRQIPRPVVAKVKGACFGAGFVIATACDVIYTTKDTKYGFTFGTVGLIPEASYFMARSLGLHKAKELFFSRAVVTGEQAMKMNFVNELFNEEDIDKKVDEIAKTWAMGPVETMGLAKEVLNRAYESTLDEQLKFEALAQGVAFTTLEHKEGVNAFLEERKAKFF
ncbi:MAG: enoyl-CoA hydratase/isomerase family protein [Candidatus Heimdallarchaeota archaeon]|nr:enoyl-CoA hydratase/isomerase family protein [Candidatus Heimdallarchaeota archaeon]